MVCLSALLYVVASVFASCVQVCVCFPNGSVASSCGSMMPVHHPYSPSSSSPPFTVSASTATYRPGGVITVMVETMANSSAEFQGFLLQAQSRRGDAVMWPVGKFTNINTSMFTALHCNHMQNSTVSQKTGVKIKKVQLTWEAPSSRIYGDIYFSVSVVESYSKFWVKLNSSNVRPESSAGRVFSSSSLILISLLSLPAYC